MGRRKVRPISNFSLRKCEKRENNNAAVSTCLLLMKKKRIVNYANGDSLSLLPHEILVCILSHLTMKEAARTSILARSWRYLWTFSTGSLNFDCSSRLFNLQQVFQDKKSLLQIERHSFVSWINQVLQSHQGSFVDELIVCFDVDSENFKCDIDSWVKFAIEKRVKRFQLDLQTHQDYNFIGRYSFPSHLLNISSFVSLTSLCLVYVDVNGELIEYLLSNCTFLEVLRIVDSTCLVSLKVCGDQSLKLKFLEISRCHRLVNLEISAVNLVSFDYVGSDIGISFKNVPRLVKISLGGRFNNFIIQSLSQLSKSLPQIQRLALYSVLTHEYLDFPSHCNIPELSNLKHLELGISLDNVDCFMPCSYLLQAAPFLCYLTLKIDYIDESFKNLRKLVMDHSHQCLKVVKLVGFCLKVVKLVGFCGFTADVELVMNLVENAVLLEKIIIEPYMPFLIEGLLEEEKFRQIVQHRFAMERAKDLGANLPASIEFVVV